MRQFQNTKNITDRNHISVNNYLKEVNRYPMATVAEEVILAQWCWFIVVSPLYFRLSNCLKINGGS